MPSPYRPDALPSRGRSRGYSSTSYDYVHPERRYPPSYRPPYPPSASASYSYRVVCASQASSCGTPHPSRGRSSQTPREVADDREYSYSVPRRPRYERRCCDGDDDGAYVRPPLVWRHRSSSASGYYADAEGSGSCSSSSRDKGKSAPRYGGYTSTTSSFPSSSRRGNKHSYDEQEPALPRRASRQRHKPDTYSCAQSTRHEVPKRARSRGPGGSRVSPHEMEEEMERLRRRLDRLGREEEERPRHGRRREYGTERTYGRCGAMLEVKPWERPKYEWQYSHTEGPDGERLD